MLAPVFRAREKTCIFEKMLIIMSDAGLGWGGELTFLALAHMLDVTQDAGLGWGGC